MLLPLLYALAIWWFSTGLIVYLDRLPPPTFRWSLSGAALASAAAGAGIAIGSDAATPVQAYLAFTCALVLWGAIEMSYLMGAVTGPWTAPCPQEARGLRRFMLAIATSLYHELAVLAVAVTLLATVGDAPNPVAAWTFAALWLMRWSSKLNIYLGVPNLNEEFLPEQLAYLKSYIRRARMNWLFPVSISVATVITTVACAEALAAPSGSHAAAAWGLVAALLALGTLEHWFLVLPFEDAALWRWALNGRRHARAQYAAKDDLAPLPPAL